MTYCLKLLSHSHYNTRENGEWGLISDGGAVAEPARQQGVKALIVDAFGTTVNWHHTVHAELCRRASAHADAERLERVNWAAFLADWREAFKRGVAEHSRGVAPTHSHFPTVDTFHRNALDALTHKYAIDHVYTPAQLDDLSLIWHDLDAWPDAAHGIDLLKQKYVVATLSNGHCRLLVDMAKHANLRWDFICGADIPRVYKPHPETYLSIARWLGLRPEQCAMVAAHANDCRGARAVGMRTVYIAREQEEDEPETVHPEEFDIFLDGRVPFSDVHPSTRNIGLVELANRLNVQQQDAEWKSCKGF
ncbi:hypothetical protein E3P77_01996 [Wallemia ichthyophaga]|uniref:(S)-2-haloacid dehalogenase 4A n=2 Tax=Wallemia ichthyophaga TaxID=245174 RepID=A0A4T0HRF0_WALIC|nr:(S)-2-haloacid dehalogenase 4A [Wallemia ichthyophaga EXF-994]TIB14604.1 hypothetical protein E3P90_01202 [Wallemia ichthyophaga]EOR00322.1 (S)-2-haloacid dehalogenase 4A [Wallemia ichthyophaga EXF-994]TIB16575.1 hypothetical protein E3P93_00953 [Wallemia ichthyophaga]TIB24627.1 hypothetical protein E3P89_00907 [Wallemia ichthyophaga]TIB26407.1 hypothetical protein E3P88_01071 [Wallemia ichthyophaga]